MSFDIHARVTGDATGFDATMRHVSGSAAKIGSDIANELGGKLAGIFSLGAAEEGLRKTIEYADKIKNLNVRTGIPVEELQKLDYAATITNSSLDGMIKSLEKFGIAQAKARAEGPGGQHFEAMRRMGLTPEDINATDKFVDNFLKAGEHIKESAIDGQLLADITETMGKSARELIPAFKDGFAELTEEAEKLGIIIPTESILRMAEASDRLKVIWLEVRAVLAEVFVAVQNAFGYMQDYVAGLFTGVVALFKGGGFKGFGEAFKEEWGRHAREREEQEVERKSKTNATVLTLQEEDDSKAREKEQRATQRKEEAEAKRLARQQEKEAAAAAKLAAFKDPYITDSLAKIGGFGQLANTKMEGLAERTAEATEKIAKNTEPSTIDEGDYAL